MDNVVHEAALRDCCLEVYSFFFSYHVCFMLPRISCDVLSFSFILVIYLLIKTFDADHHCLQSAKVVVKQYITNTFSHLRHDITGLHTFII